MCTLRYRTSLQGIVTVTAAGLRYVRAAPLRSVLSHNKAGRRGARCNGRGDRIHIGFCARTPRQLRASPSIPLLVQATRCEKINRPHTHTHRQRTTPPTLTQIHTTRTTVVSSRPRTTRRAPHIHPDISGDGFQYHSSQLTFSDEWYCHSTVPRRCTQRTWVRLPVCHIPTAGF